MIPADDVQASAAAPRGRSASARAGSILVDDKSVGGEGLVEQFSDAAERRRRHAGRGSEAGWTRAQTTTATVVSEVAKAKPDLVYFGGGAESNAVRFWRDLRAELPDAPADGLRRGC